MNYQEHIIRLQTEVNRTFGYTVTSMFDFELLAEKIHLSTQTLRRFYGKIDKDKQLSAASLNLICQYIGFADWESFCAQPASPKVNVHQDQQLPGRTGRDELRHGAQQQGQAGSVQTTHGQRQMLELGETLHTGQPSARRTFMRICRENTRRLAISHGISCRRRRLRDEYVGLAQHRAGRFQR